MTQIQQLDRTLGSLLEWPGEILKCLNMHKVLRLKTLNGLIFCMFFIIFSQLAVSFLSVLPQESCKLKNPNHRSLTLTEKTEKAVSVLSFFKVLNSTWFICAVCAFCLWNSSKSINNGSNCVHMSVSNTYNISNGCFG